VNPEYLAEKLDVVLFLALACLLRAASLRFGVVIVVGIVAQVGIEAAEDGLRLGGCPPGSP
jgi:hypothetical protein